MNNLAIIPARSGSKGVKDKNIRNIYGKPIMLYTLEAAVYSGVFSEVMVSTDSRLYAEIAEQVPGVSVPFLRSAETAGDKASTWDAVREVLDRYETNGRIFDMFAVLQPTSPLRSANHIKEAYALYCEKHADSVAAVCELGHPINICNTLPEDHSLVDFIKDQNNYTRQMNPKYYRINGAIYMSNVKKFQENRTIYKENSYAYIMPVLDSVDIDTEDDLLIAEWLLSRKISNQQ